MKRHIVIALLLGTTAASYAQAQEVRDSVKIYFPVAKHYLDMGIPANERALSGIMSRLTERERDSVYAIRKIVVEGAASPEGGIKYNYNLSRNRANTLFNYISGYTELPDSVMEFSFLGRDWAGLIRLVEEDTAVPYRDETLALLRKLRREADLGILTKGDQVAQLRRLRKGVPYRYMYRNLFPELRQSNLLLWYERVPAPEIVPPVIEPPVPVYVEEPEEESPRFGCTTVETIECKPFYMDINTNMLYDAAAIPNIGVEFYLGKNLSIDANWMYAWWNSNRRHRYWRTYGGDVELRWWFGSEAHAKPLTGHNLGVYFQTVTYDFEFGGKGYMAGKPGGTLWDRANIGGGISYGYSLPVARRLNIDFEIGVGYMGGRYYEYVPDNGCYVWQATKHMHWFGPTKLGVSLVWLIGCDNYNRKKVNNEKDSIGE